MRVALTGVPGVGKTTIADALARRGWRAIHLNELAKDAGLLTEKDEARGAWLVDMDALNDALPPAGARDVVEGHFAHELDVDAIVLLRADPALLVDRLRARAWREEKVRENVEAEALDVLAQEVLDAGVPAREIDVTALGVEEAADAILAIVERGPEALKGEPVGSLAWPLERLPWF